MPQPPKPRSKQQVRTYVSPKSDYVFWELKDSAIPRYKEPVFGTAHPDTKKFPNHKLIFAAPFDQNEPTSVKWYYASNRVGQDDYNFSKDKDKVVRTYLIPRSDFLAEGYTEPNTGDPDPTFGGYVYAGPERQTKTGDAMLDTYFVTVERTYVNANRVLSESEQANPKGERGNIVTIGSQATAEASPGIVVSRSSNQSENQLWRNTENRITPREGVLSKRIIKGVGFKEVNEVSQVTENPMDSDEYSAFAHSLVVTDVEGQDRVWEVNTSRREVEPAVGYETTRFLGGGRATREVVLVDDTTPAQEGFHVINSKVNPIGNGDAIKDTVTLHEFPILVDYRYDNTLDGFLKITKEVEDLTLGDAPVGVQNPDGSIEEIQAVDKWRSIRITTEGLGVARTHMLPGVFNFRFPPVLKDARWIGAWAYAINEVSSDYDFDIALIFDVAEAFSAAVNGRVIRVVTNSPESVIGDYPATSFKPQSHTIGQVYAAWYASASSVWAKASARTWQTPLALNATINLTEPFAGSGEMSVNGVYSSSVIPATSPTNIPAGWITIGITTNRLKLGYYEVLIRQINSPGV